MMSEQQLRAVALFFAFALPEERIAMQAAEKAVTEIKSEITKSNAKSDESKNVLIVRACRNSFQRSKKQIQRRNPRFQFGKSVLFPDHTDPSPWIRFQAEAGDDELLAVILNKILKIPEVEIAQGLDISDGTVRYRVSRAVRRLGRLTQLRA